MVSGCQENVCRGGTPEFGKTPFSINPDALPRRQGPVGPGEGSVKITRFFPLGLWFCSTMDQLGYFKKTICFFTSCLLYL